MLIHGNTVTVNQMMSGLIIWDQSNDYKKFFDYLSTSHYYNVRCTFNFINQVKRR